jgi:hypothetical protein
MNINYLKRIREKYQQLQDKFFDEDDFDCAGFMVGELEKIDKLINEKEEFNIKSFLYKIYTNNNKEVMWIESTAPKDKFKSLLQAYFMTTKINGKIGIGFGEVIESSGYKSELLFEGIDNIPNDYQVIYLSDINIFDI